MLHRSLHARLLGLCVLLVHVAAQAGDLYVSTNGTPSGPGTLAQPYDLATALSGLVGKPGDTFWLTGGNYVIGHINTKIAGAPGQPITFRQIPGVWARLNGSVTFFNSPGYLILRDFELYSSDTNRASAETQVGFNPTDINIIPGIASYAPNMSFINLIVHDETRHGFYISQTSSNNLIYGCVVYNNGWRSPDNAEGHGIYMQGSNGGREVENNIVFNNSGADMHIYENETNLSLAGIILAGNVAFNAGAIQNVRLYRDWIVGVDAPGGNADGIVFENNMGYFPPTSGQDDQAQIGRQGINGSVAILDNYLPEGLEINNWTIAAISGNLFGAQPPNNVLTVNQQAPLAAAWNGNTYAAPPAGNGGLLVNSLALGFSNWQSGTGYDLNSTYRATNLSGTKIFIRPNWYVAGRANIIVYNWDNLPNVSVDVSSVLSPGEPYEVRNAADFFAPPILSGVFSGAPLVLPMTGLTVAVPNGPMMTPLPTGPAFNVFVLQPLVILLQEKVVGGQIQLSWPTNSANWTLQFTPSLSPLSAWTDVTSTPAAVNGQYVLGMPISGNAGFYRLKAAW
jgi:hypothetical protein